MFGICTQRLNLAVPATLSSVVAVMAVTALLALNVLLDFKMANRALIFLVSVVTVLWLKEAKLPTKFVYPLSLLSGCLLEIYLLHSHVFLRTTGFALVDFIVSCVCVTAVSLVLAYFASRLRGGRLARGNVRPAAEGVS